jgi:NhaP-type Na+/H+ and K+/H+ antiporter
MDSVERNMDELFPKTTTADMKADIRSYNTKKGHKHSTLLPIKNLRIDNSIRLDLMVLQDTLKLTYFDSTKINSKDILALKKLNEHLFALFVKFIQGLEVEPVSVMPDMALNDPSPLNNNRASVIGLETDQLPQELTDGEYFYNVIDNEEAVALSLYFKYTYIPAYIL